MIMMMIMTIMIMMLTSPEDYNYDDDYDNYGQFYITCPVGIGLGCISKWLGWIPPVAPLRVSTFPTATINIFSTHQTFGTKKKKIPHTPRFFLEDVPKGCKVSDIRTDIHVHIVLEFCAKNSQ